MPKLTLLATTLFFCSSTAFSQSLTPQSDAVWITIGSDVYQDLNQTNKRLTGQSLVPQAGSDADVIVTQASESSLAEMTELMHHKYRRCGGYMVHSSLEAAQASLTPLAVNPLLLPDYQIDEAEKVNAWLPQLSESEISATITSLSSFTNRFYTTSTGVSASQWIKDKWSQLASSRPDIQVDYFSHSSYPQDSVIMTIPGSERPEEVVVLGGHLDSTVGSSTTEGTRAPGADDDASGIATLTEVIRVALANGFQPERTVKFMAYAAEEVGLRGSGDIAASYRQADQNVVGVMQLDMTNYQGSVEDIVLISDYTNAAQNQFLENLAQTYLPHLSVTYSECGYACSDHASWHNQGYPASIPFEARFEDYNPYIHSANDTLQNSGGDSQHALKFAQLATSYLIELGYGGAGQGGESVTEHFDDSVNRNAKDYFGPFDVAPGSMFVAEMTGSGDADLYVRFGSAPTNWSYDCRPYENGSDESCRLAVPANQDQAYIMVHGYRNASYSLDVTYQP